MRTTAPNLAAKFSLNFNTAFVLVLGLCLLAPIPLSNVPVSLTVVLVAFAYLEEDGVLLASALVLAVGLFAIATLALWSTGAGTLWLVR